MRSLPYFFLQTSVLAILQRLEVVLRIITAIVDELFTSVSLAIVSEPEEGIHLLMKAYIHY